MKKHLILVLIAEQESISQMLLFLVVDEFVLKKKNVPHLSSASYLSRLFAISVFPIKDSPASHCLDTVHTLHL